MANLKEMTREDFIELFGMDMNNPDDAETMECIYDENHADGESWYEIARAAIAQMNWMIRELS